jgi:hypothetical protein
VLYPAELQAYIHPEKSLASLSILFGDPFNQSLHLHGAEGGI